MNITGYSFTTVAQSSFNRDEITRQCSVLPHFYRIYMNNMNLIYLLFLWSLLPFSCSFSISLPCQCTITNRKNKAIIVKIDDLFNVV